MRSELFERFLVATDVIFSYDQSKKTWYNQYRFPQEHSAVSSAYAAYLAGEHKVENPDYAFPGEQSSFIVSIHRKAGPVVTIERVPFILGMTDPSSMFQRFLRWRMENGV